MYVNFKRRLRLFEFLSNFERTDDVNLLMLRYGVIMVHTRNSLEYTVVEATPTEIHGNVPPLDVGFHTKNSPKLIIVAVMMWWILFCMKSAIYIQEVVCCRVSV